MPSDDTLPPGPPPPRRGLRTPASAIGRALRRRLSDSHLPPDNDPDPAPTDNGGGKGKDAGDGLTFPLRSTPKWVPREKE